jgi:hypothetical protein
MPLTRPSWWARPTSALFAAATSLEWISQGAESVDWWDLNNFGSPTVGDYGMLSSGSPETEPAGAALPPYYGEELASMLTGTGSRLTTLATGASALLGFQSDLNDQRRVLLINTGSSSPVNVTPNWFWRESQTGLATYSASTASRPDPIARSAVSASTRLSLPAQSIMVLSGTPRF